ncbi:MAG: glycosyltransferase [Acidobacteria bacterium]|nr:glycosyltransferase [Acidobacteriota bacterium]MBI3662681.1 glycosyltransferase [Acidobacteriota bacterium]
MEAPPSPIPTVGYIASTWPRLSQTFVLSEVLAMERKGVPLRIFSVKDPGGEPVHARVAQVRADVTYLAFSGRRKRILRGNLEIARARPGRYVRALLHALSYARIGVVKHFFQAAYLANLLRRQPVAHLHAHFATAPALVAMFTSELSGIPYSFTAHARDIYVDTRPRLLRAEIERARAVVTVSEYNRSYLLSEISPGSNDKVHCIYNGLDLSEYAFRWPRASALEPLTILSVARLIAKKGLEDLIDAASILQRRGQDFRVEIIGTGPLRPALETRAALLGLSDHVSFLGAQPQERVRHAYQQAAIFALPCVVAGDGDRDGIPTVLLEAMASGLPVISTPVSGIPELIESGRDGLLVAPNKPELLADALDGLLNGAQLRERLARAAREKIESRFQIEHSSRKLLSLFQAGESQ